MSEAPIAFPKKIGRDSVKCKYRRCISLMTIGVACFLVACSSFQPTAKNRGTQFPLPYCTETQLLQQREKLIDQRVELEFSDSWVCVTRPLRMGDGESFKDKEAERMAFSLEESKLRAALEAPFVRTDDVHPRLGVALSGGGSKAAAFDTGLMAGLADHELLDRANYISTVSGGSYAGYFYYSHKVFPLLREGDREIPNTRDLYTDCIRMIGSEPFPPDDALKSQIMQRGACLDDRLQATPTDILKNKYQAALKCQQDVFRPGVCSTRRTTQDFGISPIGLIGSVALLPVGNLFSTVFDTGISISPSLRTYRDGIGVAYGSTIEDMAAVTKANNQETTNLRCQRDRDGVAGTAFDCTQGIFNPDPVDMTFKELRAGLLKAKYSDKSPLPFWIINAAAPRHRSAFGWWSRGDSENSNNNMFEMTAVSHGSGRFGYVSAPMSLHGMSVLDSVTASAAFFDSNQLVIKDTLWRGLAGVGMRLANLDWGVDIANYNTSDSRRALHRVLPIPFYWLDGFFSRNFTEAKESQEMQDRVRSSMIRIIDGGNAENLGVYSLIKRGVRNIVVGDAASDPHGTFGDICALKRRLEAAPSNIPRFLYIPGLKSFNDHCDSLNARLGYDLYDWPFDTPVMIGCVLHTRADDANCKRLNDRDIRLLIVKPAMNVKRYKLQIASVTGGDGSRKQFTTECWLPGMKFGGGPPMMSCDVVALLNNNFAPKQGKCQSFPQHSTALMTVNSSASLFSAYRELGRQYIFSIGQLLKRLVEEDADAIVAYENIGSDQSASPAKQGEFCY